MMAHSLIDPMRTPPVTVTVAPDENVVQGDIDETLILPRVRGVPLAQIELHRDQARGLWMWAVNYNLKDQGSGHRVGPKWGKFAVTRDDALHWARARLLDKISGHNTPETRRIRAWAEGLV